MIKSFGKDIALFLILVFVQSLLLNNIEFNGLINPYLYVLFILMQPFELPAWILLFMGFSMGISIDLFRHTLGMHTAATVLMAFARPYILSVISPRDGYGPGTKQTVFYYGFIWYLKYAAILVLIHHFSLFYIEVFRISDFFQTFSRVILSSIFSVAMLIICQYIFFRK